MIEKSTIEDEGILLQEHLLNHSSVYSEESTFPTDETTFSLSNNESFINDFNEFDTCCPKSYMRSSYDGEFSRLLWSSPLLRTSPPSDNASLFCPTTPSSQSHHRSKTSIARSPDACSVHRRRGSSVASPFSSSGASVFVRTSQRSPVSLPHKANTNRRSSLDPTTGFSYESDHRRRLGDSSIASWNTLLPDDGGHGKDGIEELPFHPIESPHSNRVYSIASSTTQVRQPNSLQSPHYVDQKLSAKSSVSNNIKNSFGKNHAGMKRVQTHTKQTSLHRSSPNEQIRSSRNQTPLSSPNPLTDTVRQEKKSPLSPFDISLFACPQSGFTLTQEYTEELTKRRAKFREQLDAIVMSFNRSGINVALQLLGEHQLLDPQNPASVASFLFFVPGLDKREVRQSGSKPLFMRSLFFSSTLFKLVFRLVGFWDIIARLVTLYCVDLFIYFNFLVLT